MIVTCEQCGKKYRLDPDRIKGESARFKCRACDHVIKVLKPAVAEEVSMHGEPLLSKQPGSLETAEIRIPKKKPKETAAVTGTGASKKLGIRGKMAILFLIVPAVVMGGCVLFSLWQFRSFSTMITEESSRVIDSIAERAVEERARSVAAQVALYVRGNVASQDAGEENLSDLRALAVQKVGTRGYTSLYERPDSSGVWTIRAHHNSGIVGMDMRNLRSVFGVNYPGFWKIVRAVKDGKESRGIYPWQDEDGRVRNKFMVCTPVEGTHYVVAATTYLGEFHHPLKELNKRVDEWTGTMRYASVVLPSVTLLLMGFMVFIFSHRLTGKIQSLAREIDHFEPGKPDGETKIEPEDELGQLLAAVRRMKERVKGSLEKERPIP
jgi:HAMP domain-containing protein